MLTRKEKANLLRYRGKCPYVSIVGGVGYVCNYNPNGGRTTHETNRAKLYKCEGCPKLLFANPNVTFNGDLDIMRKYISMRKNV